MSKEQMFWLADGCLNIGGVDYYGDKPLPVGDIDKKRLEKWISQGKIGGKVKASNANEIDGLKEQVKEQAQTIKDLESEKAKLLEKIVGLESDLASALAKAIALESELEEATKPEEDEKPEEATNPEDEEKPEEKKPGRPKKEDK